MPCRPLKTVTHGVSVWNIEGFTLGNQEDQVAGYPIGVGSDTVGLRVIGIGGSKDGTLTIGEDEVGTNEGREVSSGKDGMSSGTDMLGTGTEAVGASAMLM